MSDFVALGPTERVRFSGTIGHFLRLMEQLYYQRSDGTVEREVWDGFENQLHDLAAYPGFHDWWPTRENWYGKRFRNFVNSRPGAESRLRLGYEENDPGDRT